MKLEFTKMHGLGNDFVLFNGLEQDIELSPEQVRVIADRHFGIGCDQVLLLQPSQEADVRYRIFNADGAEVEQCGNGVRCIADFPSIMPSKTLCHRTAQRHSCYVSLLRATECHLVENAAHPYSPESCHRHRHIFVYGR